MSPSFERRRLLQNSTSPNDIETFGVEPWNGEACRGRAKPLRGRTGMLIGVILGIIAATGCGIPGPIPFTPAPGQPRFADTARIISDSIPVPVHALRSLRHPEYPVAEMTQAANGLLVALFVIDTSGQVELPTISFARSDEQDFERSVCEFLRSVQYVPITIHGHPRRVLVRDVFQFSMTDNSDRDPLAQTSGDIYAAVPPAARFPTRTLLFAYLDALPHCPVP